jgi:hypothetical protein
MHYRRGVTKYKKVLKKFRKLGKVMQMRGQSYDK